MIKILRNTLLTVLLFLLTAIPLVIAATSEPVNPTKAALKSSALVKDSEIKADCLIKTECDQVLKKELANVKLGYILDPLGELTLSRQELREKLGSCAVKLEIPEKVVIRRQGEFLKSSDIIAAIKKICNPESEDSIEIDTSRIPHNIILPGNLKSWELKANSANRFGMRLFSLTADTDGGRFRQLIQVSVVKIIEAATMNRLAKPGEKITSDMISKKRVAIKNEQANLPITYEQALGKYLCHYKSAGTILRHSDIQNDEITICTNSPAKKDRKSLNTTVLERQDRDQWVVKPGDNVDYNFSNGALRLSFPARALEGGKIGDQINLINLINQKKVHGVITDKGRVEYAKN